MLTPLTAASVPGLVEQVWGHAVVVSGVVVSVVYSRGIVVVAVVVCVVVSFLGAPVVVVSSAFSLDLELQPHSA